MARDDERRKSFWDEEEENVPSRGGAASDLTVPSVSPDAIDAKMHDTKVMMEQVHQLYHQYFNGVERRPPIEKANVLEARIKELERLTSSGSSAMRFKIGQFILQYKSMREMWERKLRDMERK